MKLLEITSKFENNFLKNHKILTKLLFLGEKYEFPCEPSLLEGEQMIHPIPFQKRRLYSPQPKRNGGVLKIVHPPPQYHQLKVR